MQSHFYTINMQQIKPFFWLNEERYLNKSTKLRIHRFLCFLDFNQVKLDRNKVKDAFLFADFPDAYKWVWTSKVVFKLLRMKQKQKQSTAVTRWRLVNEWSMAVV